MSYFEENKKCLFESKLRFKWIVGKVWDPACTAVMVDYQGLTLLTINV